MATMLKNAKRILAACLAFLMMNCLFAQAEMTTDLSEDGRKAYNAVAEYIDQGDAKQAASVLADAVVADEVYACLREEDPALLDDVILKAMCFFNEDGELFNIVSLRLKGFISNALFQAYWERTGAVVPADILSEAAHSSYDVYLYYELLNWYERGSYAYADIIDLRWLGMIDDALYIELVNVWQQDLMDSIDVKTYVPLYGMRLSETEKEQIRAWQVHVDEGNSHEAVAVVLNEEYGANVYRWLLKDNAVLVGLVHAQVMFENALAGAYELNMHMILGGFVTDACFERYWSMLEYSPAMTARASVDFPNVDMYLVQEVARIYALEEKKMSLLQWLESENLIDEYTYELLVNWVSN